MLKILYIVGTGSKYSDIELRWSLRSVEKFAQCDVQPVVVGSVPDWFKGDALPCPDKFERKEKNLNHKIMTAIRGGLVQGEFQISADDHFWLKPIDFEKLPVYYRGGLLPTEAAKGDNNYAKALVGTGITLGKFLHPKWNTACHRNAWASADDIDKVKSLIDYPVEAVRREPRRALRHGRLGDVAERPSREPDQRVEARDEADNGSEVPWRGRFQDVHRGRGGVLNQ